MIKHKSGPNITKMQLWNWAENKWKTWFFTQHLKRKKGSGAQLEAQPKADRTERMGESIKKRQRRADIAGTITKSILLSMGASRRTNGLLRMHLVELPQLVKHPELKSVEWSIPLDSIPLSTTYWRSKPPS